MTLFLRRFVAAFLLLATWGTTPAFCRSARLTQSFDADWRFFRGDVSGAQHPIFHDNSWRRLSVPHDWSIEEAFDQNSPTRGAGAFLPAGVGWYRKHFTVPTLAKRRRVFVDFDGVMANSEVWINGHSLGKRPNGTIGFRYELTGHLRFGRHTNVLAVRADNSAQPASRWYAGGGIYRHVRLVTTNPVHLAHWGTFVSMPIVTANGAKVQVKSTVENQSESAHEVSLELTLIDPSGGTVATVTSQSRRIEAGKSCDLSGEFLVTNPQLWDTNRPALYRVVARLLSGRTTLDDETVSCGIRSAHFEAKSGFWLNGRNLKIKGVCLHQDASALGVAVPLRAWQSRLATLKQIGVNAIRTAHNPPSPDFLDLCDRMGFLVMDELFDAWTVAKNRADYHLFFREWARTDTRDTVMRDRNHPSVILYSAGNEIHDTPKAELAKEILSSLVATFHDNDPTRPVTQGLFRPNVSHDYENGLADLLDVVGQNYREREILAAHRQKPTRKIIGTENTHDRASWLALRDNPPYSGQFLWAGIDYLGESRQWPAIAVNFGLLDRTGMPRPLAYQRQSWWSDQPMVFLARRIGRTLRAPTDPGYETTPPPAPRGNQVLFSDWTPQQLDAHPENVEVYSNCQSVELFLNGESLGAKARPADDSARNWTVPFAPGTIRALASNNGRVVATHELRTAGAPARLVLLSDRSTLSLNWDDVANIHVSVVDASGVLVPTASHLVTFNINGLGAIVGVDSADNASHEPFQANQRLSFAGRCLAIIKANGRAGRITLTASAPGLQPAAVVVEASK